MTICGCPPPTGTSPHIHHQWLFLCHQHIPQPFYIRFKCFPIHSTPWMIIPVPWPCLLNPPFRFFCIIYACPPATNFLPHPSPLYVIVYYASYLLDDPSYSPVCSLAPPPNFRIFSQFMVAFFM